MLLKEFIKTYDLSNSTQDELIEKQLQLFKILQIRESSFGFNSETTVHYPERDFFESTMGYLSNLINSLDEIGQVVILTTYDEVTSPLLDAGYSCEKIHLPAGPDNTAVFRNCIGNAGNTLYIEAVNEQDPKITPTFVTILSDAESNLIGGMSGSIYEKNSDRSAYISTVVVNEHGQKGSGTAIARYTIEYLKNKNVNEIGLGTQTAESFYLKLGFTSIHSILKNLRYRIDEHGQKINQDLVIMKKRL
ncbi:GNAT family N-acetyltransferase [Vibrio metoecus]|uniref:GNAT family N-acetyltransferase n=1 Tax=Vibrio metoecus TaxID=1481663 RepID=UPI00300C0E4D